MKVTFESVAAFGIEESLDVLNRGFSDYVVPIQLTRERLLAMARLDSVDFEASRVVVGDGRPAGVALMALREDQSRLAAMCIVPEARGQGLGRDVIERLLQEARSRGDRRMDLEVIQSNRSAVRLYESSGFRIKRQLHSFELDLPPVAANEETIEAVEVAMSEVASVVAEQGISDLPWQTSAPTISALAHPSEALQLGDAYAVISDPESQVIAVQCLIVRSNARRQGQGARLIHQLMARYPGKKWRVPAICPEEIGGFFDKLGFARGNLSQFQMETTF